MAGRWPCCLGVAVLQGSGLWRQSAPALPYPAPGLCRVLRSLMTTFSTFPLALHALLQASVAGRWPLLPRCSSAARQRPLRAPALPYPAPWPLASVAAFDDNIPCHPTRPARSTSGAPGCWKDWCPRSSSALPAAVWQQSCWSTSTAQMNTSSGRSWHTAPRALSCRFSGGRQEGEIGSSAAKRRRAWVRQRPRSEGQPRRARAAGRAGSRHRGLCGAGVQVRGVGWRGRTAPSALLGRCSSRCMEGGGAGEVKPPGGAGSGVAAELLVVADNPDEHAQWAALTHSTKGFVVAVFR